MNLIKRNVKFLQIPTHHIGLLCTVVLLTALFFPLGHLRLILFFVFSGITVLLPVLPRWNFTVLLLSITISSLAVWALIAPIFWFFHAGQLIPYAIVLLNAGSTAWLAITKSKTKIFFTPTDLITLLSTCLLAIPLYLVFKINGPLPDGSFIYRMGIEGDGYYMFSMIHQSAIRGALPTENLLIPRSPNLYLYRLHAGLGALATQSTVTPVKSLWYFLPFLQISSALAVPAIAARFPGLITRKKSIILLVLAGIFAACRIDLFIFPLTNAIAFPYFFLAVYLLGNRSFSNMTNARLIGIAVLTLLIGLSHVISLAALITFLLGNLFIAFPKIRLDRKWLCGVAIFLLACVLMYLGSRMPFGEPNAGRIHKDAGFLIKGYWAVWYSPLVISLAVILMARKLPKHIIITFIALIGGGLLFGLSGVLKADSATLLFNVFNSNRFFHFAFFAALPCFILLPSLPAILLSTSFIVFLPKVPDVFIVLTESPRRVTSGLNAAYEYIRQNTPLTAVFYDNLSIRDDAVGNHTVAAFTGRPSYVPNTFNNYGQNMISAADWQKRKTDYYTFFNPATSPEKRMEIANSNHITHVLLHNEPNYPPSAELAPNLLPPGKSKIIFSNRETAVLEIMDFQKN